MTPTTLRAVPAVRRRHGDALRRRRETMHLLLILPAAALVVLLIVYPVYLMADIALRDLELFEVMRAVDRPPTLRNFEHVLGDPRSWHALRVTAVYVAGSTGLAFAWGLATALLLDRDLPARRLLRVTLLSPWAVASVIASLVWMFLLNGQVGLVNHLLLSVGLASRPIDFTVAYPWAMVSLVVVSAWKSYPFFTIMMLAGLQAVPKDSLDAARVDGAGAWRRFLWVVLPSLRPVIAVAVPLGLLSGFREVETILVLTGGGPNRATETIALSIYNQTFEYFEVGRASAMGVLVFALALLLVLASFRLMARRSPAP